MLNGFEQETDELSDYERDRLMPVIVRSLKKKIGKANAITNAAICEGIRTKGHTIKDRSGRPWFNPEEPIEISEVRVRKIINHIRRHNIISCLVAGSVGYYVATNLKEIELYIQSLKSRENEIKKVREAFEEEADRIRERIANQNNNTSHMDKPNRAA